MSHLLREFIVLSKKHISRIGCRGVGGRGALKVDRRYTLVRCVKNFGPAAIPPN